MKRGGVYPCAGRPSRQFDIGLVSVIFKTIKGIIEGKCRCMNETFILTVGALLVVWELFEIYKLRRMHKRNSPQ